MKWLRKTTYCIAISLMLTAAGIAAEKDKTPVNQSQDKEKTKTVTTEKSEPQKGAAKAYFPELSHEFKPVPEGIKVSHDFVIQNKGTEVLKIKQVRTG